MGPSPLGHTFAAFAVWLATAAPAVLPQAPSPELCLVGAEVLDPDTRTAATADVIIAGEQIVRVGKDAGATCKGERLDLSRRTIMPGLIDTHVHGWGNPSPTRHGEEDLGGEATLALVLRAGVMATLDLAGSDEARIALRDRLRASHDHAALFVGAPIMARDPDADAEALRARVRGKAARRPDFIKIIATGGKVAPLVEEARKLGLPTVVHISTWDDARRAVAAGATAITHFEDEVIVPVELAGAWSKLGAWSIPTLAVQCDLAAIIATPRLLEDPLLARMSRPALRAAYRDRDHFSRKAEHWIDWQSAGCVAHDFVSLVRLHQAGVRILAGSDTGNLGTFQGFSLHRELELSARAGLPAWDVLRAATSNAAALLGIPWGVRAGAPANLIVLSASPLEQMRNTRRLEAAFHRGKRVPLDAAP